MQKVISSSPRPCGPVEREQTRKKKRNKEGNETSAARKYKGEKCKTEKKERAK